jgi:hypothetical protein
VSGGGFDHGFRRGLTVLALGVGLALTGVALGLLYLDVREMMVIEKAEKLGFAAREGVEGSAAAPGDDVYTVEAFRLWRDPTPIWIALISGSLGAALVGSSLLMVLYEVPWFRGGVRPGPGRSAKL